MKGVRCFKCQKTGHLAKNCTGSKTKSWRSYRDPPKTKSSFRIGIDCPGAKEEIESRVDKGDELWLHTIVAEPADTELLALQVAIKGPTYKVDIVVDGIRTGAF